ncbi:hypothetical protein BDQ94DRAFT_123317 [Aspergillus welwitschiae]|uniref:Zn(2)-C6 fungal-type domain-containing protein n=1 Tax=Aspergillus welwitschiae TaxID=1341132 RepID=A0A3F3PJ82_9EURO|nr:hypothetical protein BDQ94DRAFT_123317 [Aspergillus welwitschiae]RDH27000.1 hypothetical protein BDQ94DRAFT_123317 [Aspergillus welwitschiae]
MGKECVLKRFSRWFWQAWMVGGLRAPDSLPEFAVTQDSQLPGVHQDPPGLVQRSDTIDTPFAYLKSDRGLEGPPANGPALKSHPCMACKAWGVSCNQQRPRCTHCLEQQILCFYVARAPKSSKKSTDLKEGLNQLNDYPELRLSGEVLH